jgi:hypothetical protein
MLVFDTCGYQVGEIMVLVLVHNIIIGRYLYQTTNSINLGGCFIWFWNISTTTGNLSIAAQTTE